MVATAVLALTGTASAQAPEATSKTRLLGMRVESMDLSEKDRGDLFQVIQHKLRAYPTLQLIKPPETDITDEMMELECIDIDNDCLGRLGRKYGAERVVYAQVDKIDGGYAVMFRVTDVGAAEAVRDRRRVVSAKADLAEALESEIEAALGPPPPPPDMEGRLTVVATIPGAKIDIDGEYVGTGRVSLMKKPGKYSVRVWRAGHEDALFDLVVTAGGDAEKTVKLDALPEQVEDPAVAAMPTTAPAAAEEETQFYETWWFWTTIGVVVAGGTALGVVMATRPEERSVGNIQLSMDPAAAWRDTGVRGGLAR